LVNPSAILNFEELNNVLRTNGHTQVDEDDDSEEINVEDCDGYDDDKIEKEDNFY
jgi:hypothetical protein